MFEIYGATQSDSTNKVEVNYEELNNYVVETAQLQERETLIGVVSGIVDLGTQDQPDSEVTFTGSAEDEEAEIEKNPNTYFKDGFDYNTKKNVRLKCWPNKPIQCVALAIDFPDIMIDKGQFFGNSKELPLRIWMGGQFYLQNVGMVVGRPIPLKVNKKLGDWSFDVKHQLYKMAVDSKLIKPGEVFAPKSIDKLLGKAFQFTAQVFFKPGKDGKQYYTEYIKYVGALGRKQEAPEFEDTFMIQFNKENDEQKLKEVRGHVLNTIKQASNYKGSVIASQLGDNSKGEDSEEEPKPKVVDKPNVKVTPAKEKPKSIKKPVVEEDFDSSDLPF